MINSILNSIRNTVVVIAAIAYYFVFLQTKFEIDFFEYFIFSASSVVILNYFVLGVFAIKIIDDLISIISVFSNGEWDVSKTVFLIIDIIILLIIPVCGLSMNVPYKWYIAMLIYLIIEPLVSIPITIAQQIVDPGYE